MPIPTRRGILTRPAGDVDWDPWIVAASMPNIQSRLVDHLVAAVEPPARRQGAVTNAMIELVRDMSPLEVAQRSAELGLVPSQRDYHRAISGYPNRWPELSHRLSYIPAFVGSWRFIFGAAWLTVLLRMLNNLVGAL